MKPFSGPHPRGPHVGLIPYLLLYSLVGLRAGISGGVEEEPLPSRWVNYTNTNRVYEITPDGDQIWFGTEGGLKRFDRVTSEWTRVTTVEGLRHRPINAIVADHRFVWIGSQRGGLAFLNRAQGSWIPVSVAEGRPAQQRVLALALEGDTLWVGTDGAGVARYDLATRGWTTYTKASTEDRLQSDVIYDLVVTPLAVWAATGFGLSRFDRDTEEWVTYRPPDSPLDGRVEHIAVQEGNVWVATETRGVALFEAARKQLTEYTSPPGLGDGRFHALISLPGYLWLGTGRGVIRIDTAQGKWDAMPETPWYITALGATSEELWIATANHGLRRYDFREQTWTVFPETDPLPGDHITCIAGTPTTIWFGLSDQGIFRLDLRTQTWDRFSLADGLPSLEVHDLVTLNKEVWCATSAGVGYYNGETGPWQTLTPETTHGGLVSNEINALLLHGGRLWFAGAGGLSSCTLQMTNWQKWLLKDLRSTGDFPRLLGDRALDAIWVVGPRQAWRFNRSERDPQRQWTSFRNPFRPTSLEYAVPGEQLILSAATDLTSVWFLCVDGLRQYEKQTREWWIHDERTGVPLMNLTCLALGPRSVWCGTQDGLYQFDREDREWIEIGQDEGELPSFTINSLAFDEEALWVATSDGVARYDPQRQEWDRPEADLVAGIHDIFLTPTHVWFAGKSGLSAYLRSQL